MKVEVAVLGSPSLISLMVSLDVEATLNQIRMLCFIITNSVLFNLLSVWSLVWFGGRIRCKLRDFFTLSSKTFTLS